MRIQIAVMCLATALSLGARNRYFETDEDVRRTENITTGGFGTWAVNDSYLSPLQYQGWGITIANERSRDMTEQLPYFRTEVFHGWRQQWGWTLGYGKGNNKQYNTMRIAQASAGWAGMYQWSKSGWTWSIGPYAHMDFCGHILSSYVNRPYNMDLAVDLNLRIVLRYETQCGKNTRFALSYTGFSPLGSCFWMPEYGESYYELQDHIKDAICWGTVIGGKATNGSSRWGMTHALNLDFRFRRCAFRLGAQYKYYDTKAHQLHLQHEQVSYSLGWIADLDIRRGTAPRGQKREKKNKQYY